MNSFERARALAEDLDPIPENSVCVKCECLSIDMPCGCLCLHEFEEVEEGEE
jgi:hypothetical protein